MLRFILVFTLFFSASVDSCLASELAREVSGKLNFVSAVQDECVDLASESCSDSSHESHGDHDSCEHCHTCQLWFLSGTQSFPESFPAVERTTYSFVAPSAAIEALKRPPKT